MQYKGNNQPSLATSSGSILGWIFDLFSLSVPNPAYKSAPQDTDTSAKKRSG